MNKVMYVLNDIGLRKDVKEKLVNIIVGLGFITGFISAVSPLVGA